MPDGTYRLERLFADKVKASWLGRDVPEDWREVAKGTLAQCYEELRYHAESARRYKWKYRLFDPQGKEVPLGVKA